MAITYVINTRMDFRSQGKQLILHARIFFQAVKEIVHFRSTFYVAFLRIQENGKNMGIIDFVIHPIHQIIRLPLIFRALAGSQEHFRVMPEGFQLITCRLVTLNIGNSVIYK